VSATAGLSLGAVALICACRRNGIVMGKALSSLRATRGDRTSNKIISRFSKAPRVHSSSNQQQSYHFSHSLGERCHQCTMNVQFFVVETSCWTRAMHAGETETEMHTDAVTDRQVNMHACMQALIEMYASFVRARAEMAAARIAGIACVTANKVDSAL